MISTNCALVEGKKYSLTLGWNGRIMDAVYIGKHPETSSLCPHEFIARVEGGPWMNSFRTADGYYVADGESSIILLVGGSQMQHRQMEDDEKSKLSDMLEEAGL